MKPLRVVAENAVLWAAYHLLMLARAYPEAEAVARRCVQRHGLPGDYLDLISALRAQGKHEEAARWVEELERRFPRLRHLYGVERLRRLTGPESRSRRQAGSGSRG